MQDWISVKEQPPPHDEPVLYMRFNVEGTKPVGIAYWTISKKWKPEFYSEKAVDGFTHWAPIPLLETAK